MCYPVWQCSSGGMGPTTNWSWYTEINQGKIIVYDLSTLQCCRISNARSVRHDYALSAVTARCCSGKRHMLCSLHFTTAYVL
jgi:hypothetical protein